MPDRPREGAVSTQEIVMSAVHSLPEDNSATEDGFLPVVQVVERHAKIVFRDLSPADREEAVAEAVAAAFISFRQLKARGIDAAKEFPSMIATFAAKHVRNGRHVGGHSSSRDVLSKLAQRRRGFKVEPLPIATRRPYDDVYGAVNGQRDMDAYEERLAENRRTPVPEQVAFRIDFKQFVRSLSARDRRLARYLSLGHRAKDAARRFKMSAGRVTQLRQAWCRDWHLTNGEEPPANLNSAARKNDAMPQAS